MKKSITLLSIIIFTILVIITPCHGAYNKIHWTGEERAFMEKHPIIRLGVDPKFIPFEFIDENSSPRIQ